MPAHRPVIDFHAHFVPGFYRDAAAAAGYASPDGMPGLPRWSVREALDMMDRNGITTALTAAIRATPLLDQEQLTAMMTTNGLPLLRRLGA